MEKLTKKENEIIYRLQSGWILITSNDSCWIRCCGDNDKGFLFGTRVFANLLEKELIAQQLRHPFNYVLTQKGKEISVKEVKGAYNPI